MPDLINLLDADFVNFLILVSLVAIALFSYYMSKFHFLLFAFFLAFSAVLFKIEIPGIAWIALATCLIVAVHWVWVKFKEKVGKARGKMQEGLEKEWEKIEKAKGSYPSVKTWDESLHAVGKKSAEALFAKDGEKYSSPQTATKIGKGSQNFIDGFLKIFKK